MGTTPRSIWIVGQGHEADRHAAAWATLARVTLRRVAPDGLADRLSEHLQTKDAPLGASICVPRSIRASVVRTLLDAGVHTLVEAPVCETTEEMQALSDCAHDSGRLLVPAQPILYTPGMLRVMELVGSRRLGAVQNVYSYRHGPLTTKLADDIDANGADAEIASHAAIIKTLCLFSESRLSDIALAESDDGLWLTATMYYADDILATVRVEPESTPQRRGAMVTLVGGVLRWECTEEQETLTFIRGARERAVALRTGSPHREMVSRFLHAALGDTPPYEDADAAARALDLELAWRRG